MMNRAPLASCLLLAVLLACSSAWSPYSDPHMYPNRSVISQMFEWRFDDLAEECEQFLGPYGFGGIQVSPPVSEHAIIMQDTAHQPWWQRYQVVSYKLHSRSGTKQQLQDMIHRCNRSKVRVYIDVIPNHMTGNIGSSRGSAGSEFDSDAFSYLGVAYNKSHFNSKAKCGTSDGSIQNYEDKWQLRNCELVGLHDLDQSQEHVRNKLVDHLNELVDMGAAGFRVDASKHVYPDDLKVIFSRLHNLNSTYFGTGKKAFLYHEVSRSSDPQSVQPKDYVAIGRVLNFSFMRELAGVVKKENQQRMKYLKNFGSAWGFEKDEDVVNFIDSHDVQREAGYTASFRNGEVHKMATAFMLSWPYGVPKIMSSFDWKDQPDGKESGPPHEADYQTKRVRFSGMTCQDGWVCEHRWRQVYNMVAFRNAVGSSPVSNWWDNDWQQIAYARHGRGFIAINNEDFAMHQRLQTSLPAGVYCDVVSGTRSGNKCTGKTVEVDSAGMAVIAIPYPNDDSFLALHVDAKIN